MIVRGWSSWVLLPRIQISHRGFVSVSYRQQFGSLITSPFRLVVVLKTTPSISSRRPLVVSMTMLFHPSGRVSHEADSVVCPLTSFSICVAARILLGPWWLLVLIMASLSFLWSGGLVCALWEELLSVVTA